MRPPDQVARELAHEWLAKADVDLRVNRPRGGRGAGVGRRSDALRRRVSLSGRVSAGLRGGRRAEPRHGTACGGRSGEAPVRHARTIVVAPIAGTVAASAGFIANTDFGWFSH